MPGSAARRVPLHDFHFGAADRQAPSGHILCNYGISGRGRVASEPYRSDEDRVARDIGAVVDLSHVFLESVPVRRDAARANIHVRADYGVAKVGKMRYGAPGANFRVLDLGVGPHPDPFSELGSGP